MSQENSKSRVFFVDSWSTESVQFFGKLLQYEIQSLAPFSPQRLHNTTASEQASPNIISHDSQCVNTPMETRRFVTLNINEVYFPGHPFYFKCHFSFYAGLT